MDPSWTLEAEVAAHLRALLLSDGAPTAAAVDDARTPPAGTDTGCPRDGGDSPWHSHPSMAARPPNTEDWMLTASVSQNDMLVEKRDALVRVRAALTAALVADIVSLPPLGGLHAGGTGGSSSAAITARTQATVAHALEDVLAECRRVRRLYDALHRPPGAAKNGTEVGALKGDPLAAKRKALTYDAQVLSARVTKLRADSADLVKRCLAHQQLPIPVGGAAGSPAAPVVDAAFDEREAATKLLRLGELKRRYDALKLALARRQSGSADGATHFANMAATPSGAFARARAL